MQLLTTTKALNPTTFTAALVAALPALVAARADGLLEARYTMALSGDTTRLELPDDVSPAAVQAVITAHDATIQSAAQQTAVTDNGYWADLAAQKQAMLDAATAIEGRMDTILAGPAAPSATNTGTALKMIAGDVKLLVAAERRLLRAVEALLRRQAVV